MLPAHGPEHKLIRNMKTSDLWLLPNLLSLARIVLAPLIGYFLWRNDPSSTVVAAGLFVLAGLTDGLDGYLARRRRQISSLGIFLDPLADKVFALILISSVVLWRDLPLWLAAVIVGRDLIILGGGLFLRRRQTVDLPSNLTGQYAFAAVAVLLASYVIRFEFGIKLMTVVTLIFLALSLYSYGRIFSFLRRGHPAPQFHDRPGYRFARGTLMAALILVYCMKFYLDVLR